MGQARQIPETFISTLNEHTTGGYLICYFDLHGCPRMQCEFDNVAYSLAAQKYLSNWLEAISNSQQNTMMDALEGTGGSDGDEGEDVADQ